MKFIVAVSLCFGVTVFANPFDRLAESFQSANFPTEDKLPETSFWGGKCVMAAKPNTFYPAYFLFFRTSEHGDPLFNGEFNYVLPFANRTEGQTDPERYVEASEEYAIATLESALPTVSLKYSPLKERPAETPREWQSSYRAVHSNGSLYAADIRLRFVQRADVTVWMVRVGKALPSPSAALNTIGYCYAWAKRGNLEGNTKKEAKSSSKPSDPFFQKAP